MSIKRRPIEVFSLSFLDIISCGFGAIVLLLVLSLALEPATLEQIASDLDSNIEEIKKNREEIIVKSQTAQEEIVKKEKRLQRDEELLDQLVEELKKSQKNDSSDQVKNQKRIKKNLQSVLQSLSKEMKVLLREKKENALKEDSVIGGIPVDSEYIVFIIDTSGSMLSVAWPTVIQKVKEVLSVYPNVKGIQVINDMGRYMFSEYAGRWIPDTPSRRKEVIHRLSTWNSFSNSSPVEGIEHAMRLFARKEDRISLYVFGDDFSTGNIDKVLNDVARINKPDSSGKTRVRIHAFGFPVLFGNAALGNNRIHFAHLMRLLAEQNSGSFVGLTNKSSIVPFETCVEGTPGCVRY